MSGEDWVTGKIGLTVGGYPLDLEMTVPARPVKPHRMLPIFHQMTNSFVEMGVQAAAEGGRAVSCKAGCGACCRQPVPLSEVEVYQLAELVENMPEPRRSEIRERFKNAVDHFRRIGWFDAVKAGQGRSSGSSKKKSRRSSRNWFTHTSMRELHVLS